MLLDQCFVTICYALHAFFVKLLPFFQTKYKNADGSSKLHIVEECPSHYYLTYLTRKDWPFLPEFNKILIRLAEGGFIKYWYDSTLNALIQRAHVNQTRYSVAPTYSMDNVKVPLYVLLVGYVLSIIVFIGEQLLPPTRGKKIRKVFKLPRNRVAPSNRR